MKAPEKRQRARRDERLANPPKIRLTERDLDIVQAVYECRVLTTQHLQTLFFPSAHTAYARLSALYHHGLLERKFLGLYADKMNTPILYILDKRGAELLRAERGIEVVWTRDSRLLTTTFLEHTLAINTVRVAVMKACQTTAGISLLTWQGENDLKADYDRVNIRSESGRLVNVSVIPDSYFALQTPHGAAHFFLELDRGTMTTKRFKTKIVAYQTYYAGGGYVRRFGARSLRVLTVTTSAIRAENLRLVAEQAGGKQRYWFTALERVQPDTVLHDPIWQVATRETAEPLIAAE